MLSVLNLFTGLFVDILKQGSAEVIFTRRSEALAALKRYNNVRLDGKAMKIEVIGADLGLSAAATPRISVVPGARGRGQREVVMMYGYGSSLAACGRKEAFAGWIHQACCRNSNFLPFLFFWDTFLFRPGGNGFGRGTAGSSNSLPGYALMTRYFVIAY